MGMGLVTNGIEIVLHNPALIRLFEFATPLTEHVTLSDYFPDESLVKSIRGILDSSGEKAGLTSRELRRGSKYIQAISAPIPGFNGGVLGTVTVFQDITTLKELDELKSSFVQMVSHELRSPLASIKQLLSVLLEALAGELLASKGPPDRFNSNQSRSIS